VGEPATRAPPGKGDHSAAARPDSGGAASDAQPRANVTASGVEGVTSGSYRVFRVSGGGPILAMVSWFSPLTPHPIAVFIAGLHAVAGKIVGCVGYSHFNITT